MPRRLLAALCLILLPCLQLSYAADAHILFGSWQVDVSKLPGPTAPASVTISWSDAGGGKVRMSVDILSTQGEKSHAEGTFLLDGSPSRAVGSLDVDVASMTMPSSHVLVMGAGMAGHPSNTRVFVVSEDARHMSETIISHGPGNIPATRVNAWTKK